jgi:Trypsin
MNSYLFTFLFLSALSLAAVNCPEDKSDSYPFVVKISFKDGDNGCTGSVFRNRFVLLAAHCLKSRNGETKKAEGIEVFGGPDSRKRLGSIRQVSLHPQYTRRNEKAFDVAVLELSEDFPQDVGFSFRPPNEKTPVTVGGFGVSTLNGYKTDGQRRMGTNEIGKITPEHICLKKALVPPSDKKIPKSLGCIPSSQDSGSAFIVDGRIVGVYTHSDQVWHDDGSTGVENCAVNLSNPVIRTFVESFGASATFPTHNQKTH